MLLNAAYSAAHMGVAGEKPAVSFLGYRCSQAPLSLDNWADRCAGLAVWDHTGKRYQFVAVAAADSR